MKKKVTSKKLSVAFVAVSLVIAAIAGYMIGTNAKKYSEVRAEIERNCAIPYGKDIRIDFYRSRAWLTNEQTPLQESAEAHSKAFQETCKEIPASKWIVFNAELAAAKELHNEQLKQIAALQRKEDDARTYAEFSAASMRFSYLENIVIPKMKQLKPAIEVPELIANDVQELKTKLQQLTKDKTTKASDLKGYLSSIEALIIRSHDFFANSPAKAELATEILALEGMYGNGGRPNDEGRYPILFIRKTPEIGEGDAYAKLAPESFLDFKKTLSVTGETPKFGYTSETAEYLIGIDPNFPRLIPEKQRYYGSPAVPAYNGHYNEICLENRCWAPTQDGRYFFIENSKDPSKPPQPGVLTTWMEIVGK